MSNKHHEVARLAYELYEKRGGCPGYEFEDWIEAERLIFMQPILVIETETEAAPKSSEKKPASQIKKEKNPGKAAAKTTAKTPAKAIAKTPAKATEKTTAKTAKKAPAKKKS